MYTRISYTNIKKNPFAFKIFRHARAVQYLDLSDYTTGNFTWDCESSEFIYNPCQYVMIGNLDTVNIGDLRGLLHGMSVDSRERSFRCFSILLSCGRNGKWWNLPSHADTWVEFIRKKVVNAIYHMNTMDHKTPKQVLKDPTVRKVLRKYVTENMLLFL